MLTQVQSEHIRMAQPKHVVTRLWIRIGTEGELKPNVPMSIKWWKLLVQPCNVVGIWLVSGEYNMSGWRNMSAICHISHRYKNKRKHIYYVKRVDSNTMLGKRTNNNNNHFVRCDVFWPQLSVHAKRREQRGWLRAKEKEREGKSTEINSIICIVEIITLH